MMTPVGQRSTQSAQRVQTSSSTTKNTWSLGSSPGASELTDSETALVESMWMHFHGQMSTQPSQRMHSAWSMCRNCLGFTAWVSHLGSTSCKTYESENSGIGGVGSVWGIAQRDPGLQAPQNPPLLVDPARVFWLERAARPGLLFVVGAGGPARVGRALEEPRRAVVGDDHPVLLHRLQDHERLAVISRQVEVRLQTDA